MANTPQNQSQPREQIQQIANWFETAIPNPSPRNALTQIGVHFEEVFEMAATLRGTGSDKDANDQIKFAGDVLHYFQRQLKDGNLGVDLSKVDRTALLDALCDQIVTAVGIAHMFHMDIEGALAEVATSNDSKFFGKRRSIFNEPRRIMKGPHYKSPDLSAYTTKGTHNGCQTE